MLLVIQLVYNTMLTEITKVIPFFINFGYEVDLY